jgi:hypothetical protein
MGEDQQTIGAFVPSFARDIRPLFRQVDIDAMRFALDLGAYDDVRQHAESVFERIEDGTMPCDVIWPEEDLGRFRAWIDSGMQP